MVTGMSKPITSEAVAGFAYYATSLMLGGPPMAAGFYFCSTRENH
jgi:hypothetical protein